MSEKKKAENKAVKRTNIGGQAVLEGVMMKGTRCYATAVRSATGDITIESHYTKSAKERNIILRLPFIRGVVNLLTQLFQGTGIIMRSAEVYGDYAEPSKFEKWMSDKFKINPMNLLMAFSVVLGVALAVGMFIFLPNFLTGLICDNIAAIRDSSLYSLWYSLIEGGIMLTIFISYIALVSLMKDIKRVFMYHGAEHKVISCYEHGLELTVENAKKMKREHSRCGTTFLFFVISVSIIVFVLINFMLERCGLLVPDSVTAYKVLNILIRLGFKLLFLPVVAGVSYELLKLLAKSDALPVRIIRAPGMLLQKLTTKEPTDDMLEVSITAFKTVLEMDEKDIPEKTFDINVPYAIERKKIEDMLKGTDEADIDWLFVDVTKTKRSELAQLKVVTKAQADTLEAAAKKMAEGMPYQYALGRTEFYGRTINLNQNVLIPRQDTEEVVYKAIELIKANDYKSCLDLCTGSGAIAVTIKKETKIDVTATDISEGATEIAKANMLVNLAPCVVKQGDMFEALEENEKFDIIVSNPPYIPSADIETLEKKVKDFEPRLALDGDKDGLKFYRIIHNGYKNHLNENGALVMEFGIGQAEAIKEIFSDADVEIIKDMNNIERIAVVK